MNKFIFLLAGGMAFASPSAAQSGPVAQQSSSQLICQLSGDCDSSSTAATKDGPKTRGFSIARPSQATRNAQPAVVNVPSVRTMTQPVRMRSSAASPSAAPVARFSIARPGRANLMVTFVSGSAILTEQAKSNAQEFVKALSAPQLSGMHFAIEGHTDAVGNRAYNLDLSQRRAQAVVDYLNAKGADRSRFTTQGYGFDKPLDARNPRAAVNRRVEVVKAN
jgi:OmpA-OmpF porin, OOP family